MAEDADKPPHGSAGAPPTVLTRKAFKSFRARGIFVGGKFYELGSHDKCLTLVADALYSYTNEHITSECFRNCLEAAKAASKIVQARGSTGGKTAEAMRALLAEGEEALAERVDPLEAAGARVTQPLTEDAERADND